MVSGVVRVPVRPVVDHSAGVQHWPGDGPAEGATAEADGQAYGEEEYVDQEPHDLYLPEQDYADGAGDYHDYGDPQMEFHTHEQFSQGEEYDQRPKVADTAAEESPIESEAAQTVNSPLPEESVRRPAPENRPFLAEDPDSRPAPFFEQQRPGARPTGETPQPPPQRPRPPRPGGSWMSGLLSGLFGGSSSSESSSSGGGGGGGGLLAGLSRRPSTPAPAPAPAEEQLPPVQSDPILAAMFGDPSDQPAVGESAATERPAWQTGATGGRPESDSPAN